MGEWADKREQPAHFPSLRQISPLPPPLPLAVAYVDVGKNMVKWESESEEGGGMVGRGAGGGGHRTQSAHTAARAHAMTSWHKICLLPRSASLVGRWQQVGE